MDPINENEDTVENLTKDYTQASYSIKIPQNEELALNILDNDTIEISRPNSENKFLIKSVEVEDLCYHLKIAKQKMLEMKASPGYQFLNKNTI